MMGDEIQNTLSSSRVSSASMAPSGPTTEAVNRWTSVLAERAQIENIFLPISDAACPTLRNKALAVGTAWYLFSVSVGELLTYAASRMDNNDERFTICQIAWEELGSGQPDQIHAEMFRRSVNKIDISVDEMSAMEAEYLRQLPVSSLREAFHEAKSATEVLGLCAGLEQPANENIESIYRALAFCPSAENALENDDFFRIHRAIEDTHISVGTTNFLRFCDNDEQREAFLEGFDKAVEFWRTFWLTTARAAEARVVSIA
jgi:Iron-containing redox enzyme